MPRARIARPAHRGGYEDGVYYSESDGQPLGETGWHAMTLVWLKQAMDDRYAGRTDLCIAADMFFYYERGNPKANKSPDLMVILGVDNHIRGTFKTWVEGTVPTVIFEITSKKTRLQDEVVKVELYASLGVPEYFLFDPRGDYLKPPFMAYRLEGGAYLRIPENADGSITSERLGVRLLPEDYMLRMFDVATGHRYLTSTEAMAELEAQRVAKQVETRRAEEAELRADDLAAEVERLKALIAKRNGSG